MLNEYASDMTIYKEFFRTFDLGTNSNYNHKKWQSNGLVIDDFYM